VAVRRLVVLPVATHDADVHAIGQPRTYGDCIAGTRVTSSLEQRMAGRAQCERYGCRHNLLRIDSADRQGRTHNGVAPELTLSGENVHAGAPSCALDVANTGPKSSREVAAIEGLTARRVEQIMAKFKRSHGALAVWAAGRDE
jgi:hypothetical protein